MKRSFAILIFIGLVSNLFVHGQNMRNLEREKPAGSHAERRAVLVSGNGAFHESQNPAKYGE